MRQKGMVTQTLWWAGNALIGLLLVRSVAGKFCTKYRWFYIYLSYVLFESIFRFCFYILSPSLFPMFYWYSQFLSVALGYGVIWEIYRQALADYPGVARLARKVLLVVFIVVVAKVLVNALSGPIWSPGKTSAELERIFRSIQAVLLVVLVGLLVYYAIPTGRNLKGMILGYGFFIGTRVISLTVHAPLGDRSQLSSQYVQPFSYLVTLLIWCSTMWSYQANPRPGAEVEIERDYELVAARTIRLVAHVRAYLLRAVRP